MGRSSRSKAEQNHARIVDAAIALFREHGVAAVSIADIMTGAGMTPGGFYKHFASKDALAAKACGVSFMRAAEAWKAKARTAEDGGHDALRALVAYYFTPKRPEGTCPMIALGQDAAAHPPGHPLRVAYREGVSQLFATYVEVAEAVAKPPMARGQAAMLFAAMVGSNLLARVVGKELWIEQMQDLVLDAVDADKGR